MGKSKTPRCNAAMYVDSQGWEAVPLYVAKELEIEAAESKARIDELMLEFCPEEMTEEQKINWAKYKG